MRRLLEPKVLASFSIGYTILLTIGSLINTGEIVEAPNHFDKVIHLVAYFGLGMAWMFWFVFWKKPGKNNLKTTRLLLVGLGVITVSYTHLTLPTICSV